jgi:hypothetical protein
MITLLLMIGFSSGVLAVPNPAISKQTQQTTRFYVWASTGPLSYLTDARITIRDAKGKLVALGKTNHRGIVGFRVRNKKLGKLPLSIVTSGGKVDGMRFSSQLKARAHEVGGKNPIIHLNLISTVATQMAGQRGDYAEAVSKVRKALTIKNRAAVDALRVKNPYVDGDRLKHAVLLAGGYTRFVRELGGLAKLGQTMNGLEPPKPTIKTRGQPVAARILNAALDPEQSSLKLEPVVTTQSNSSTLCTTPTGGGENTVSNYGAIATASLLEVAGVPLAATDGVTGMLLSSVGLEDSSPTTEALDNIAEELDCISSQIAYLDEQVNEIELMEEYDNVTDDLSSATTCHDGLSQGWQLYNTLANQGDGTINASNPNLCVSDGGACGSGDIYEWQLELIACGTAINDSLFGYGGNQDGSAWSALNDLYHTEYAWYTQAQVQALQSWLSYWSTTIYTQFVLQNEVYNFYGQWANAVAFGGGPGTNGSTACAYNQTIANVTVCQWQSNIQYAYPPDLYSDEIGIYPPNPNKQNPPPPPLSGTAINAFPGGIALGGTTTSFTDQSLAVEYGGGGSSFSNPYYASTVTSSAQTAFNNQGINPAGNASGVETYESPQAMRTLTLTSSDVSALSSPQTAGGLTASDFFFNAINQVPNAWPGNSFSASNIGYYTSDNVSIISGTTDNPGYTSPTEDVTVATNTTILSGTPTTKFNCSPCQRTSGNETILAALMGRTWWPAASNVYEGNFPGVLPAPLTVPNTPTLTALTPGGGQIQVAFNLLPESEDGGMPITGYVASCTAAGSTTPVSMSGSSSPITVINLAASTSYSCSIQAENAGGLSAIPANCPNTSCGIATTTTATPPPVATPPTAPTDLKAIPGNSQISLSFSPPTDTGGQPITGYQANCTSTTSGAASGQAYGSRSPLVVTGLTPLAEYTCSLVAQNEIGNSQAATVTAIPTSPYTPGAPVLLEVKMQAGGTDTTAADITLDFSRSSNDGGSDYSRFDASCSSIDASPTITFGGWTYPDAASIIAYGPTGSYGYTYKCTVTATNDNGFTSLPSNPLIGKP